MSPREHAISTLEFARWYSGNLLKDFPEDKYTFQPSPTDNHAAWIVGHLAGTDAWIGEVLGFAGTNVPKDIREAYSMGSKPSPTAAHTLAQLRTIFDGSRAAFITYLKTADDATLNKSIKEETHGFATDAIDAALKLAWHEGFHFGQFASIRKALGLPNTM